MKIKKSIKMITVLFVMLMLMANITACESKDEGVYVEAPEEPKMKEGKSYVMVLIDTYMLDNYLVSDDTVYTSAEGNWGSFEQEHKKSQNCVFTIEDEAGSICAVSETELYELWSDCTSSYNYYINQVEIGNRPEEKNFTGHQFMLIGHAEDDEKIVDEIRISYNSKWAEIEFDPMQIEMDLISDDELYKGTNAKD